MNQYFCIDSKKSHGSVERGLCIRVLAASPQEAASKIKKRQKEWEENLSTDVDFFPGQYISWPMFEIDTDEKVKFVGNLLDLAND